MPMCYFLVALLLGRIEIPLKNNYFSVSAVATSRSSLCVAYYDLYCSRPPGGCSGELSWRSFYLFINLVALVKIIIKGINYIIYRKWLSRKERLTRLRNNLLPWIIHVLKTHRLTRIFIFCHTQYDFYIHVTDMHTLRCMVFSFPASAHLSFILTLPPPPPPQAVGLCRPSKGQGG